MICFSPEKLKIAPTNMSLSGGGGGRGGEYYLFFPFLFFYALGGAPSFFFKYKKVKLTCFYLFFARGGGPAPLIRHSVCDLNFKMGQVHRSKNKYFQFCGQV